MFNKKIFFFIFFFLLLIYTISNNFVYIATSEPLVSEPFICRYSPKNSFGVDRYYIVNWSWIEKNVEYKLVFNDIIDVTDFIVDFNFEGGIRKYSYNFTANLEGNYVFSLEFQHGADGGYIINNTAFFNYTNGVLFYNYSDLIKNGYDSNVLLDDNSFKISISKYCIKKESVSLDPYFGDVTKTQEGFWIMYDANERRFGTKFEAPENGFAVNMSFAIYGVYGFVDPEYLRVYLCLYEYVTDTNAGALLGYTETFDIMNGMNGDIVTLNMTTPLEITASTNYFLTVCIEEAYTGSSSDDVRLYTYTAASVKSLYEVNTYGYENPWVGESGYGGGLSINCGYVYEIESPVDDDLKISNCSPANQSIVFPCDLFNFSCYTYNVNTSNNYNVTLTNSFNDTSTYNNICNVSVYLNFSSYIFVNQNVTIWVNMTNGSAWWNYTAWFITNETFCNCECDEYIKKSDIMSTETILLILLVVIALIILIKPSSKISDIPIFLILSIACLYVTFQMYDNYALFKVSTFVIGFGLIGILGFLKMLQPVFD